MSNDRYLELLHLRAEICRLNLRGRCHALALTIKDLDAAYNGCGPAYLPAETRQKLDRITAVFAPAFVIHDVDFSSADGLKVAFDEANVRLLINCVICALDAAPWNSWRRYVLLGEAWAIYRACSRFGWPAWLAAYNKKNPKK